MATTTNKRKKAVAATVAAAAILLAGTFAWTSISQTALNEAIVDINPGGRLHDDFNGSTKAVYVENFAEEKDGVPIFARIKLTEYMEIGQQAGDKTLEDGARKANVVGSTVEDSPAAQALKAEPDTWKTYLPGEDSIASDNAYSEYWTLNWGNTSTNYHYMPTFNKNKDSLEADINGTYEGTVEGDIVHYDNYIDYNADTSALTKDAVHDWDDNTIDEVELGTATETRDETSPRDSANILLKEEEHSVKTLDATADVITMAAWQALSDDEKAAQGYWVYDTDGWAYWSKPIEPGQTTGMFLNSIQMHKVPDDNWYYGLNVIGQFATKADISGFTSKGDTISDDALDLLAEITGIGMSYTIDGPSQVKPGNTYDYTTVLKNAGTLMEETPVETWTVSGDRISGITIDDGTLTVSENAAADTTFTITVEAALEDGRTLTTEKAVIIPPPDYTFEINDYYYTEGVEFPGTVQSGEYWRFKLLADGKESNKAVTWELVAEDGVTLSSGTRIDKSSGLLSIADKEGIFNPDVTLTVNAKDNGGNILESQEMTVKKSEIALDVKIHGNEYNRYYEYGKYDLSYSELVEKNTNAALTEEEVGFELNGWTIMKGSSDVTANEFDATEGKFAPKGTGKYTAVANYTTILGEGSSISDEVDVTIQMYWANQGGTYTASRSRDTQFWIDYEGMAPYVLRVCCYDETGNYIGEASLGRISGAGFMDHFIIYGGDTTIAQAATAKVIHVGDLTTDTKVENPDDYTLMVNINWID